MSVTPRKNFFQQAARCIIHPVTLGSMFLLFLNDYILRVYTPSWLTGKLGDFAWLFFFPYLIAAMLVWILPKSWLKKNTPVLISIGFTVVLFTLGKVWPVFLQGLHALMEWFLPWNVRGVIDPTDLVALVVLPGTFWLWKRFREEKPKHVQWTLSKKSSAVLCFSIAMVLTVGSKIYDGVEKAAIKEDDVYVHVPDESSYRGSDGGAQWERIDSQFDDGFIYEENDIYNLLKNNYHVFLFDPADDQIQYRIITEQRIDRSIDGGETWEIDHEIDSLTQAEWAYVERNTGCSIYQGKIGPFDAIFDPVTNNLILTMGCRGVLVRDHDTGEYSYHEVYSFQYHEFQPIDTFGALGESFIIVIFLSGLLSAATFRLLFSDRQKLYRILLLISFILVTVCGFVSDPLFTLPSATDRVVVRLACVGISAVFTLIVLIHSLNPKQYKSIHGAMIISGLLTSLTFFTCFMLWGMGVFPLFRIAYSIAVGVSALFTIACHFGFLKMNPSTDEVLDEKESAE